MSSENRHELLILYLYIFFKVFYYCFSTFKNKYMRTTTDKYPHNSLPRKLKMQVFTHGGLLIESVYTSGEFCRWFRKLYNLLSYVKFLLWFKLTLVYQWQWNTIFMTVIKIVSQNGLGGNTIFQLNVMGFFEIYVNNQNNTSNFKRCL